MTCALAYPRPGPLTCELGSQTLSSSEPRGHCACYRPIHTNRRLSLAMIVRSWLSLAWVSPSSLLNLTRALAELKQQEIDDVSEMFADMRDGHDDQDGQLP
jgi:hypothetical protein